MNEGDRIIGRLEGKLDLVIEDVREVKNDVKALNQFKWRMAGGAAILSIILTAVIELFRK